MLGFSDSLNAADSCENGKNCTWLTCYQPFPWKILWWIRTHLKLCVFPKTFFLLMFDGNLLTANRDRGDRVVLSECSFAWIYSVSNHLNLDIFQQGNPSIFVFISCTTECRSNPKVICMWSALCAHLSKTGTLTCCMNSAIPWMKAGTPDVVTVIEGFPAAPLPVPPATPRREPRSWPRSEGICWGWGSLLLVSFWFGVAAVVFVAGGGVGPEVEKEKEEEEVWEEEEKEEEVGVDVEEEEDVTVWPAAKNKQTKKSKQTTKILLKTMLTETYACIFLLMNFTKVALHDLRFKIMLIYLI